MVAGRHFARKDSIAIDDVDEAIVTLRYWPWTHAQETPREQSEAKAFAKALMQSGLGLHGEMCPRRATQDARTSEPHQMPR